MILGLATGDAIALAAVAGVFIVFAVASAFLLPRRNPDFPGRRGMPAFVAVTAVMVAAMMAAVVVFAKEEEDGAHVGEVDPAGEVDPGEPAGDAAAGARVFASAGCGSCHAFEAAGSTAEVAPDLDESTVSFEAAVEQIRSGGGGMPAFGDQLSEEQIQDVAAFVVERRS